MSKTTIVDIAKKLNLDPSTVSRALNDDPRVKKETRVLVQKTAREMHYHRNDLAANLRLKNTRTIGIIIPESENFMFMKFIKHAQEYLKQKGYRVTFAQCNENPDTERENLQMMADYQVEGIILCPCHNTRNLDKYRKLQEADIPLVFFDRTVDGLPASRVKIDDYISSFFMVEHLIRHGKRRIVHLSGPSYIRNTSDRIRAYKDALAKFRLPFCQVVPSGVSVEEGESSMEAFLRKGIPFDALFCFTENAALGAKRCLQKHGFAIPRDIAVCCVSGTDLSTWVYPTLTAIEQPLQRMAQSAVELLMEQLEHPDALPREVVVDAKMIVRESSE